MLDRFCETIYGLDSFVRSWYYSAAYLLLFLRFRDFMVIPGDSTFNALIDCFYSCLRDYCAYILRACEPIPRCCMVVPGNCCEPPLTVRIELPTELHTTCLHSTRLPTCLPIHNICISCCWNDLPSLDAAKGVLLCHTVLGES